MSRPLLIQWYKCSQCGYETAAWDQVACPKCEVNMSPIGTAGAILDNRDVSDKDV
jgi:predicted Zn-ribbon and HTH transcriptional regulator